MKKKGNVSGKGVEINSLHKIVTDYEMQFGFMPVNGRIDVMFTLRRLRDEYHDERRKLCMCFVDPLKIEHLEKYCND